MGSGSSSPSTAVIDTKLLTPLLSSLFDGDTVLLGDVATVQVLDGQPLLITAAIFLQVCSALGAAFTVSCCAITVS